ncbi:transglycosylase family protein [Janibacter melonis]|uniref:transglycosylase family protein n=1 Tax=Janibacter melonis TaxID=262209 RepID=UPI00255A2AD5|nr:transglycosylase family protein [Janibacter melonis]
MFYAPKHALPTHRSTARRRVTGAAVAGATAAVGTVATAGSASAGTVWDRVAACESGGNWSINTGNGFYGGLQFHPRTWSGFGGGRYAAYAHQASKSQQIEIAKKVLKAQGPGAWPVCSRRAGLTTANGLAVGTEPQRAARSQVRVSENGYVAVDGIRGRQTNRAIESWIGSRQARNGVLSAKWEVHRLQRKVGVPAAQRNGNINDATFVSALQRTLGVSRTGSWDVRTVKALQNHLNTVG